MMRLLPRDGSQDVRQIPRVDTPSAEDEGEILSVLSATLPKPLMGGLPVIYHQLVPLPYNRLLPRPKIRNSKVRRADWIPSLLLGPSLAILASGPSSRSPERP
jgi:hypothetical protein